MVRGARVYLHLIFGVFVLFTSLGHAQTFSVLYDFGSGNKDPVQPSYSGIIAQGHDGNLYSTAPYSVDSNGSIFMITPDGRVTVLYYFTYGATGIYPYAGLILGTDGSFYGANETQGSNDGTIFKITQSGQFSVLYTFAGNTDGGSPY